MAFKSAIIIIIYKFRKEDYIYLSIYRFIIFLNILGKLLELIIAKRLYYITKEYSLLLVT